MIAQTSDFGKIKSKLNQILTRSPKLRYVKTFSLMDGSPIDIKPIADALCPFVRVWCSAGASSYAGVTEDGQAYHKMPVMLNIKTAVASSSDYDSMDLWQRIQECFFPPTKAAADALYEEYLSVGISNAEITQPAWGSSSPYGGTLPPDTETMISQGVIRFDVYVITNFG